MKNNLGQFAKKWLQDFVPKIDAKLGEVWDREAIELFGFNDRQKALFKEMVEHARDHNLAPSKRIRSSFVFNGFKLGKGEISEGVWQAAAAVELVHTALLMHDDFMDEDLLRRGQETTNAYYAKKYGKHYGDTMAVGVGDMVLCLGFEVLGKCGLANDRVIAAMNHLHRSILYTSVGQAHDVTLGHLENWTEEDVIAVHKAKTGFYTYENPLLVGAILGGVNDEVIKILKEYAEDGGVAFQLQDDILGVFGEPDKTGKSADSDLMQGKATLLVLKAGLESKTGRTHEEVELAKKQIIESGSLEYSRNLAKSLAKKAANTAEKLRAFDLDPEAIDFIQGVAEYMVEREV